MESETVWRALASPHRRRLLDLLKDGPRTTGQLSKGLPDLSRFAVMQHLGVLEEAGLVLARKEGRSRYNHLNPVPIQQLYERWMRSHSSLAAETALHLKRYAESTREVAQLMDQSEYRHINVEMELYIDAPRERVFRAITEEYGNWWPHRYKPDSTCYCEPFVGGKIGEKFSNGGGAIYGEIVYFDPPYKAVSSGASSLNRGLQGYSVDTLEEQGEGTLVKRSMHLWGSIPENVEKMYREGSRQLLEDALRNYCEKGIGYVAPKEDRS
ncbi:MAG TPA: helix-turn-helix domain-containing protein [Fimbriimonadaceae bacterium]|nr:helix-turn-helix domain-containing protein [Fimbriimonadaceae bacterium]